MRVGRRFWWILGSVCLLLCIGFVLVAYHFDWSGFLHKTVWDWLQLLIVPLVLAIIALVFQLANARTERQIADQRYKQDQQIADQRYKQDQQIAYEKQQGDQLQAYIDRMSDLLLKEKLLTSSSEEVRNVARVRTTTVLCQLDGKRVGYVFAFLREAGLMSTQSNISIVSLLGANLSHVNWCQADLTRADLTRADLTGADLTRAYLHKTNFTRADLTRADLTGADLTGANLTGANLDKAIITKEQLAQANPRAKA